MKAILLLTSLVIVTPAFALETLGVVGPVTEAKPYYENLLLKNNPNVDLKVSSQHQSRIKKWTGDYSYDSLLSAGTFQPRRFTEEESKRFTNPICLLANDAMSKRWLRDNKDALIKANPICYLVKVRNQKDINDLKEAALNLRIFAVDPSLIITKFSVAHYPALISSRGVEQ